VEEPGLYTQAWGVRARPGIVVMRRCQAHH